MMTTVNFKYGFLGCNIQVKCIRKGKKTTDTRSSILLHWGLKKHAIKFQDAEDWPRYFGDRWCPWCRLFLIFSLLSILPCIQFFKLSRVLCWKKNLYMLFLNNYFLTNCTSQILSRSMLSCPNENKQLV